MTTTASTATTPAAGTAADSRALGLAHYAARGVLEHVLARHGVTFPQQIALRAAVTADAPQTSEELVAQVVASVKSTPDDTRATLDELLTRGLLVAEGPHLRPTDAGRELLATVGAQIAPISARVWADIPTEDLLAAGRVLSQVTARANAELAALTSASAPTGPSPAH
ncbi:MarR family transcriptional regulator [Streptomyces sp. NPDC047981]|uniref:MarR family transcriptional regulator n=1 Tax=Streptomyces sp. NPDC047981 TaxID=3154610 RepID=UPI003443CB98